MKVYFNRHESSDPRRWCASMSPDPKDYCSTVRIFSSKNLESLYKFFNELFPDDPYYKLLKYNDRRFYGGTFCVSFKNDDDEDIFLIRSFSGIQI
jgi:hypothetical protein